MTLLLTLAIESLNPLIEKGEHDILDCPKISSEQLGLRGVMVDADHLSGWEMEQYDAFRNAADKVHCPCLLLRGTRQLDLFLDQEASRERILRLAVAANRLGCNAVAISPVFPNEAESVDHVVAQLREAMSDVERLDLNLLLQPTEGFTSDPDELIEVIKKIGGFRIGALPTFSSAAQSDDPLEALRKLAPYAGGVIADFPSGRGKRKIDPVDGLLAVREVGYSNSLALQYIGTKKNPIKEIETVAKQMKSALEENK
ncbi:MAG: TIM barrel protein [Phycisphaerales bacterium]|jgi:sugar phosphate isomerase/epimerase|nr:TIM barrel protein [Phycisphaerales bacterium]